MFRFWSYWLMVPVFLLFTPFTWPWIKSKNREIDFVEDDEIRLFQCISCLIWFLSIIFVAAGKFAQYELLMIVPSCIYCFWLRSGLKTWAKKVEKKVISYNAKIEKQQGQLSESNIS